MGIGARRKDLRTTLQKEATWTVKLGGLKRGGKAEGDLAIQAKEKAVQLYNSNQWGLGGRSLEIPW